MRRNIIAPATINYPLMDAASEKNRKRNVVKTVTTVSETIDKIYLIDSSNRLPQKQILSKTWEETGGPAVHEQISIIMKKTAAARRENFRQHLRRNSNWVKFAAALKKLEQQQQQLSFSTAAAATCCLFYRQSINLQNTLRSTQQSFLIINIMAINLKNNIS